jgi:hypothetical protein
MAAGQQQLIQARRFLVSLRDPSPQRAFPPWRGTCQSEILRGAMSEENVEILRRMYNTWNRSGRDAAFDLADRDGQRA